MDFINIEHQRNFKQKVLSSLVWLGGLKYFGQLITWILSLIVIRLLNPEDYGIMAMALALIGFLTLLSELGLSAGIIQNRDITKSQLAQIFGIIALFNCCLSLAIYLSAPFLSLYYAEPTLVPVFRLLSVNFIFMALYALPKALLFQEMNFRCISLIELSANVTSGILVLTLAILGFGVWALIWGTVLIHFVLLVGYQIANPIIIRPRIIDKGLKQLLSFSLFVLGSQVIWSLYTRTDVLIGGRLLSTEMIGVYSVAMTLSAVPLDKIAPVFNQVAFPAYSQIKSDPELVCLHFLKAVRLVSLLFFPICMGLLSIADETVALVLGNKWKDVVIPFQILCIVIPIRSIGTLIAPVLNGIGRSDVNFYNNIIAFVVMPPLFLLGTRWGIVGLCWAWVCGYFFVFLIISSRFAKVIGLKVRDFFLSFHVPFIASILMAVSVQVFKGIVYGSCIEPFVLGVSIIAGIVFYTFLIFLMKPSALVEAWELLLRVRKS